MPEHNLIQRPDIILRLGSYLGLRQAHITPTLAEHVVPVVVVGDVGERAELATQARYSFQNTAPLNAANFSIVELLNPINSRVNLLPVRVYAVSAPVLPVRLALSGPPGLVGGISGIPWGNGGDQTLDASHGLCQVGNIAGIGQGFGEIIVGNSDGFDLTGIVIPPGDLLRISTTAINTALQCTIVWDEVPVVAGPPR